MEIWGLKELTLVDYPKKVACSVFTPGCNFRCPYCYNPELVFKEEGKIRKISEEKFFSFLDERKNKLDGVVLIGGEPTIQPDITEFARKIKEKGFLVKLDTNGSRPGMIKKMIENKLVDYIAMDVKNSFEEYEGTIGVDFKVENIRKSIQIIKKAGEEGEIDYEFRTTVVPSLVGKEELEEIGEMLEGSKKFFIQQFNLKNGTLNPKFEEVEPYSKKKLKEFKKMLEPCFGVCEIRG